MMNNMFTVTMVLVGLFLFVAGTLAVFSDKFLSRLYSSVWKNDNKDATLFTGASGYLFNRYGRGLGAMIAGMAILLSALNSLFYFAPLNDFMSWISRGNHFLGVVFTLAILIYIFRESGKFSKKRFDGYGDK